MALALLSVACAHRGAFVPSDETVGRWGIFSAEGSDVADDGSWVFLASAALGDPFSSPSADDASSFRYTLMLSSGRSIGADAHLAAPGSEHVVLSRDDRYVLVDVARERELDMMPTHIEDGLRREVDRHVPLEPTSDTVVFDERAECYFGFSGDGQTLAWMEPGPAGYQVVVHDLEGGSSHIVEPGPGIVTRMRPMPDGDAVMLSMLVERDVAGADAQPLEPQQRLKRRWPRWPSLKSAPLCAMPYDFAPELVSVTRVFALDGEELDRRDWEYVRLGRDLVRPSDDGGVWRWIPGQREHTHLPLCEGEIVHVDHAGGRMLMLCDIESAEGARDEFIRGRLVLQTFDDRVEIGTVSLKDAVPRRGACTAHAVLSGVDGPLVVDLDRLTITVLPRGRQVLAIAGGTVLMRRAINCCAVVPVRVELFDLSTRSTVGGRTMRLAPWSPMMRNGTLVALGPWVFDLEAGRVVGKSPGQLLGITEDRRLLLYDGNTDAESPFRWYSVRPSRRAAAESHRRAK